MDGSTTLKEAVQCSVTVTDAVCVDCGGPCTLFCVIDKLWDGLGFAREDYACLECLARRLCPEAPPDTLGKLREMIVWKRRRFGLKDYNLFSGNNAFPLDKACFVLTPDHGISTQTVEQAARTFRKGEHPEEDEKIFYPPSVPFAIPLPEK
jgi:hypothetical protein